MSAQSDLQTALDGKSATGHGHAQADVTGLVAALAGKAASSHTHAQAEITNLVADLAAKAATNHTHAPTYAALAAGTAAMGFGTASTVKVTPNANVTITTTVPPAGTPCWLIILTSGTTTRTITFGSGFKPVTATLVTGTVTARVFVVSFISDGVNLYETARTAAMVA